MTRKRYTSEQISAKFPQAEALIPQCNGVTEACWCIEVTEQAYYRGRKEQRASESLCPTPPPTTSPSPQ
jgi:hypothetical protein